MGQDNTSTAALDAAEARAAARLDAEGAAEAAASATTTEPAAADAGARPEGGWSDEYVETLRRENADFRTKYKPFGETFKDYTPDEVATFMEVARALKTDPVAAADWFEDVARAIKGDPTASQEAKDAVADATGGEDRPLTRKELDAIFAEREGKQQQLQTIKSINKEIRKLGYDPEGLDGIQLQFVAVNQTGGDLKEADKIVKAQRQAIIDEYVEGLKKNAGAAGVTPEGQGFAPSGERKIRNLDDAEAAMKERLRAAGMA